MESPTRTVGRLVLLLIASFGMCTATPLCDMISRGGYLSRSLVIRKSDSPCVMQNDLIIPTRITLTLNAGVELRFAPGVMLAVNGTLLIKVAYDCIL